MRLFLLAILACCAASAQTTITWRQLTSTGNPDTWPRWAAQAFPKYDPVSGRILVYMQRPGGASNIYATDIYAWSPTTEQFTLIPGGLGTRSPASVNNCEADTGASWPGQRHPDGQMVIDTTRNRMWFWGALNQACAPNVSTNSTTTVTYVSGIQFFTGVGDGGWAGVPVIIGGNEYTIDSVTSATSLELTTPALSTTTANALIERYASAGRTAMWHMALNADPTANTFTLLGFSGQPTGSPVFTFPVGHTYNNSTAVYSPDTDLIYVYRGDGLSKAMWTFNPATYAWAEMVLSAGTVNVSGTAVTRATGTPFVTDGSWAGKKFIVHSGGTRVDYTIASVESADALTLTASGGTKTGWDYGLRPSASKFVGMVYDEARQVIYLHGGQNNNGTAYFGETWKYTSLSATTGRFDLQCLSDCTPPPTYGEGASPAADNDGYPTFVHWNGKYVYHDDTSASRPGNYIFDPDTGVAGKWTPIQTGEGPISFLGVGSWDGTAALADNKILWLGKTGTGYADVWVGTLTATATNHRMRGSGKMQGSGRLQ